MHHLRKAVDRRPSKRVARCAGWTLRNATAVQETQWSPRKYWVGRRVLIENVPLVGVRDLRAGRLA